MLCYCEEFFWLYSDKLLEWPPKWGSHVSCNGPTSLFFLPSQSKTLLDYILINGGDKSPNNKWEGYMWIGLMCNSLVLARNSKVKMFPKNVTKPNIPLFDRSGLMDSVCGQKWNQHYTIGLMLLLWLGGNLWPICFVWLPSFPCQ